MTESKEIQLYNKLSNDVDTCVRYCEKIKENSNFCNECWKYKQYTNFECMFFLTKNRSKLVLDWKSFQCSKKCVACLHVIDRDCPLLGEDPNLVKRLFISFKIKIHIPTEESFFPRLENKMRFLE